MTKDLDTEKLLPFIPLKRFGTAEEVAGTLLAVRVRQHLHLHLHPYSPVLQCNATQYGALTRAIHVSQC